MKNVLITGANSYIGTNIEEWLKRNPEEFQVYTVDTFGDNWKQADYTKYDAVFHVAGIAHVDPKPSMAPLYYKVNRDLTIEIAKYAKEHGVKQFVFMSSEIVYHASKSLNPHVITPETQPDPNDFYGDSKVQAENGLLKLADESFHVVILRPPMIYGKGSKGNYPQLSKFAQKLPLFPYIKNERSMLYIGNLTEFVKLMIDNNESGIFYPQNAEYVATSEMVQVIAQAHGKKTRLVKGTTVPLKAMSHATGLVNKAFGNLSYDMSMSEYKENYRKFSFEESIRQTEVE